MSVAVKLACRWQAQLRLTAARPRGLGVAEWGTVDLLDGSGERRIPRSVMGPLRLDGVDVVATITDAEGGRLASLAELLATVEFG